MQNWRMKPGHLGRLVLEKADAPPGFFRLRRRVEQRQEFFDDVLKHEIVLKELFVDLFASPPA